MSLLSNAIGTDIVVTAAPTGGTPTAGEIRFDWRSDNLVIMWRYSGTVWQGRCISPRIGFSDPNGFVSAQVDGDQYIDITNNVNYFSATAGSFTWVVI
jgi:hypothetical protein